MQTFSRCFAKIHKYLFLQKNICRIDECEYVRMFVLHNICKARLDNALYTGLILSYLGRVRTESRKNRTSRSLSLRDKTLSVQKIQILVKFVVDSVGAGGLTIQNKESFSQFEQEDGFVFYKRDVNCDKLYIAMTGKCEVSLQMMTFTETLYEKTNANVDSYKV